MRYKPKKKNVEKLTRYYEKVTGKKEIKFSIINEDKATSEGVAKKQR